MFSSLFFYYSSFGRGAVVPSSTSRSSAPSCGVRSSAAKFYFMGSGSADACPRVPRHSVSHQHARSVPNWVQCARHEAQRIELNRFSSGQRTWACGPGPKPGDLPPNAPFCPRSRCPFVPEARPSCAEHRLSDELATLFKYGPNVSVPAFMIPTFRSFRERMHGRCFVLLGDSTMVETALDLALLLGAHATFEDFITSATRMPQAHRNNTLRWHGGVARFFPNQRNMSIVHLPHRSTGSAVVFRYIGHSNLMGQHMGIKSLENATLRAEIRAFADEVCGSRRREVWLQSGYHDTKSKALGCETVLPPWWKESALSAFDWVETLAPQRAWLSRDYTCQIAVGGNVTMIEAWVEPALRGRRGWRYVDHRRAWMCDELGQWARPDPHTGPIKRGYAAGYSQYCCNHLSVLRTLLAIHTISEVALEPPSRACTPTPRRRSPPVL